MHNPCLTNGSQKHTLLVRNAIEVSDLLKSVYVILEHMYGMTSASHRGGSTIAEFISPEWVLLNS